ncbi:MAG: PD40 domain-containing protein [Bacteroidetes bacterium]|nr:PD40 domain-containing protein [Bacteroidota bacterium]
MPKLLLALALLFVVSLPVMSQEELARIQIIPDEYAQIHHQGEQALLSLKYREALSLFKKVLRKFPDFSPALRSSGACYELMGDLEEASKYYVKALETSPHFSRALYFECGKIYYQCGKYKQALRYFEQFDSLKAVDSHLFAYNGQEEQQVESKYYGQLEANIRACYTAVDSASFWNIGKVANLGRAINSGADEYFPFLTNDGTTIFYTSRKNQAADENLFVSTAPRGDWRSGEQVEDFNTAENEGMVTMVRDGRRVFFTACQREEVKGPCDIWEANTDGFHLENPSPLPGNANSDAWESQASISCDGSSLYFASNREGGLGGTDLWVCKRQGDGRWGEPQNLGPNVNTTGDEEAPFITNDGKVLYFSSTGHLGLGEQDIFMSRLEVEGAWGFAVNLGTPVNSSARELGFFLTADGKTGYFASNRSGGFGGMDIYKFDLPERLSSDAITYVEGFLKDSITHLSVQSTVYLKNRPPVQTDSDGRFFLCVKAGDTLSVEVRADDYHVYKNQFAIPHWGNRSFYNLNLLLDPLFKLPAYTGELTEKGGAALPVNRLDKEVFHEILFDFDKAELRADDIDNLEAFFQNTLSGKQIQSVEVIGFADEVGSNAYNLRLSEKRAKAVGVLLKNKGIRVDKIYIEGKGESANGHPKWQNRKVDVVVYLAK